MNGMKTLVALGALAALTPLARAEVASVVQFEGNNLTVHVNAITIGVGERVHFDTMPDRSGGGGNGVVTDIDVEGRNLGIVLDTRPQEYRVYRNDSLTIRSLQSYVADPPEFRVERPEPRVSRLYPAYTDIQMPRGYFVVVPTDSSQPQAPGAPGNRAPFTPPTLTDLLRSQPSGTAAPQDQNEPNNDEALLGARSLTRGSGILANVTRLSSRTSVARRSQ